MFVYTAKFSRGKAVALVLLLGAVLCCLILFAGGRSAKSAGAFSAVVRDNEQRVAFLESLGWKIGREPLEEQTVVIPQQFGEVYGQYNELQRAQGFDLTKYAGCEATRYSYEVTNYPGEEGTVVADMIVYRGRVIAGDVQSAAIDGFMQGLAYPKSAP
ncbi:MAG: DUF4830 domain-containing protein [Oscillospiraceae bacterium]|nr:DUF4830 domain-containing protein [Oscillospiraceae bacterium]